MICRRRVLRRSARSWRSCIRVGRGSPVMVASSALAHIPRVAERVTPRLGPHGEPMGLNSDLDDPCMAGGRVERVDDVVVAARKPKRLAIRAHIAHVRTSSAGDGPGRIDLLGGEIHDGY